MNLVARDSVTEFDRIFDSFFHNIKPASNDKQAYFSPSVDIEEHGDCYLIKADLPGIKKEDLKVTLENGVLSLEAERLEQPSEQAKGKLIRQERRSGKYARSFQVGRHLAVDDIKGSFEDGVLCVTVQKDTSMPAGANQVEIN